MTQNWSVAGVGTPGGLEGGCACSLGSRQGWACGQEPIVRAIRLCAPGVGLVSNGKGSHPYRV